ncbi:MAG: DNA mismatch repair protein MutS, partial [Spirochaetales bacterium]|nr:DNA mismatch repair protein MutS [Spirochaetales bacterium]
FQNLAGFCERHTDFQDELVVLFEREIQFYAAYLDYIRPLKDTGLGFCYPQLVTSPQPSPERFLFQKDAFDLALAKKLGLYGQAVITNEFYLSGPERILVVNGPNQGGKTTFARAFGQAHYLGNLGCPVPGTQARLLFYDQIFTHFEKEEQLEDHRGKLYDDLARVHEIVNRLTPQSLFILNEIFNSTTVLDALELARRVFDRISEVDAVGVCVTFLDELADFNEKTVSMMSTVNPEDPASRTFKVIRKPADGLAFALAIAEKYNLTYNKILARLPS